MTAISSFIAACVRYSSQLRVPNETLESLERIHESYGKLGIIVNDIHSFEKELRLWKRDHKEGAKLLNIVNTMSIDAGVSYATANAFCGFSVGSGKFIIKTWWQKRWKVKEGLIRLSSCISRV
ncbi:hypothetical protein HO173_012415 [Letharia columbiana]|uniref:Uncharacterized protein n=1 Tax=Letharia columbiana TaxID=112416 RepID=A0A8H6FG62_9LECA|nr:uncharacterized protein HO173_012415 [Letharia columbiana]KAF6226669.1 hypothetical protein HO173_012415 [Letharia columbiana]